MKSNFSHSRLLAALGAAFSMALGGASSATAQNKVPIFDAHSILVLSSSATSKDSALSARGLRVTRQFKNIGWSKVALSPGADVTKTVAALRAQGLQVEPNYIRRAYKTPNDPLYSSGQWDMAKIGAPAAWDVTTGGTEVAGGKDVVVAVLDSGITPNHPDLKANLYVNKGEIPGNGKDDDGNGFVDDVNGYDFARDDGIPDDGNEHGTHVAGTIGAVGNNKLGVSGINWRVKLLSCRVLGSDGSGSTAAIIAAMDYMVGLKKAGVNIRVANHSYGSPGSSQAELAAFQRAAAVGILDVCAAGNDGYNNDIAPNFPASYDVPGLISVAASDQNDMLADFSNVGFRTVDLAAPGVDILSTLPPGIEQNGSLYGTLSGTSMASPHVAGALALMLSQTPTLSMQQAQARLFASVDKLPQLKGKVATGGRLNLAKMLSGSIYVVSGRITRPDNTPVSGATVTIHGTGTATTTTDSNGFYRFSALPLGRYILSAQLTGFKIGAATGSSLSFAFSGTTYSVTENFLATPTAKTYSVSGTAYNAFGKAQADVQIFVNSSPQPLAVTNTSGKYTIDDLIAGTYKLSALYHGATVYLASSSPSTTTVTLPTTTGTSVPNAQVNWQVPSLDRTAPTVVLSSPVNGQTYTSGQLKAVAGNAFDNDLLTRVQLYLYKLVTVTQDGFTYQTYVYYDWTTGTFSDGSTFPAPKSITEKSASATFTVPLSTLDVGSYYLDVLAIDRTGNYGEAFSRFLVTNNTQPNPAPQDSTYPRFTFTNPSTNAVVRANSPFTATGTAHSDNGVQTLNFYLQQVDERGLNIAYYDWTNKKWVSEPDAATTLTQNVNGGSDVKWSLPIPALPSARYVLHAYGVALDGSQPPADGSLDDSVAFRAGSAPSTKSSTSGS